MAISHSYLPAEILNQNISSAPSRQTCIHNLLHSHTQGISTIRFLFCCLLSTFLIKEKKRGYDSIPYSSLSLRSIYEENISYSGHINYIRPQIYHNICLYSYIHLQFNPQFWNCEVLGNINNNNNISNSNEKKKNLKNNGITHLYKFCTMDAICIWKSTTAVLIPQKIQKKRTNSPIYLLHYNIYYLLSLHKLLKKNKKLKKKPPPSIKAAMDSTFIKGTTKHMDTFSSFWGSVNLLYKHVWMRKNNQKKNTKIMKEKLFYKCVFILYIICWGRIFKWRDYWG